MTDDIVELVKARNLIEDVIVGDGFPLPTRGRYRKCTTANTGGLVIDVQKQSFHWNTRAEFGDVIQWVMNFRKLDFKQAVEWLAARARLPQPEWGQDPAVRMAARAREDALSVAAGVFVRWLRQSEQAMEYCASRGWSTGTDEDGHLTGTIAEAMLGYSGEGSAAQREEMRAALHSAGVDIESPAAVAIIGYKGNVVSWAGRGGLPLHELNEDWVSGGYIPSMVGRNRLVYPYLRGGRVVYLSGRGIGEKLHYNLPVALVGKRQVYLNHEYAPAADVCVVVEGQADAVSLGQWGVAAVALAGVAMEDPVRELLGHHKTLYVGLDADQAGDANSWKLAEALGPMVRMVRWNGGEQWHWLDSDGNPQKVKDANDLLKAAVQVKASDEDQRAKVKELLEKARTYVEAIAFWAGCLEGAARDEGIQRALKVVAKMEEAAYPLYRTKLAKALGMTVRDLENNLKTIRALEKAAAADGEPVFTFGGWFDGWLVEYLYDAEADRAALAWRDPEGRINCGDSVVIDGTRYLPEPPNSTIQRAAILFPNRVGEAKTIRELVTYIELYIKAVYLLPNAKIAGLISYYVLLTWVYDMFETGMYLRAMGSAGSGKSELLRRIGLVCYRTINGNGAGSTSSLFRTVERYRCTVFIDEADIQGSDTENDMVKFYNLGAMRGNPIWRTEKVVIDGKETFQEIGFQTFCPKLVAMRKDFRDDAVGSRSLTFKLQPRETIELVTAGISLTINETMRQRAQAIRNMLLQWRLRTWQPTMEVDSSFYDLNISARLNQVAGPLLALAAEDPEQQEEIRKTLREYYAESILSQSMTLTARVIEALWKIYKYPDLRLQMVRREADGSETIKIGDVTKIANQIMDEMNEGSEEDDGADTQNTGASGTRNQGKTQAIKAQRIGRILREELQLQVSERRRDGFWVYWNEARLVGLAMRYGVKPEELGPQGPGEAERMTKAKEIPHAEPLL